MDDAQWRALANDILAQDSQDERESSDADVLLGEQGVLPGDGRDALGSAPLPPDTVAAMNDDAWQDLANQMLANGTASESEVEQPLPSKVSDSNPRRGRPPGSFGSRLLRAQVATLAHVPNSLPTAVVAAPAGSAAYAREMKKRKREARMQAAADSGHEALALPGTSGNVWETMKALVCNETQCALINVAAQAMSRRQRVVEETDTLTGINAALDALLFQPRRSLLTVSQLAEECNLSNTLVAPLMRAAAVAAVESSKALWGAFLCEVGRKLETQEWQGIMICHRCRYDETPTLTRLRAQIAAPGLSSSDDTSAHGKVVQAEASLHMLLATADGGRFFEFAGKVPTTLQVAEATTAECLKRARCNVLGINSIPSMMNVAKQFKWSLQLATVDRYAANFKAEYSLLHDCLHVQSASGHEDGEVLFSKLTLPCDVHRIHQAHSSSFALALDDISGLLSTSLAQHGSGTLDAWREILTSTLEQRLVICYDTAPAGEALRHREAVYDLYLPVRDAGAGTLSHQKRRHVLSRTLNGYLGSEEVVHFCCFGCCRSREETYHKIRRYTTTALLPSKLKKFAKNRWTGHLAATSYCGLLAAHHDLLTPLVLAYTGGPVPQLKPADECSNEAFVQALADEMADSASSAPAEVTCPYTCPEAFLDHSNSRCFQIFLLSCYSCS